MLNKLLQRSHRGSSLPNGATTSSAYPSPPSPGSPQFDTCTTWTFTDGKLPLGLGVSTSLISGMHIGLHDRRFTTDNVWVEDDLLQLKVPGGQTGDVITCAEVHTKFELLYGSVRTYAVLTEEPGVCNGMFMYHSDNQETDIEWISDPRSSGNLDSSHKPRAIHYANQAVDERSTISHVTGPAPNDATSDIHEYRIDWSPDCTQYYIDGVLQQTITTNVPSKAGRWMWNNWTNGNRHWTSGPPVNDAIFKIQKIVLYYDACAVS